MRTHTVWIETANLKIGQQIELNQRETHHLINVLRIANHTEVKCLNGKGTVAQAICNLNGKQLQLEIIGQKEYKRKSQLHLFGPIPKGKRSGFMFEKLQEIGVSSFTPINTEHSQKNELNPKEQDKIQQKSIDACKQSLCPWLLELKPCISFLDLLEYENLHFLNVNGSNLSEKSVHHENINLAFGPEGGWSQEEENTFFEKQIQAVKCNPNILRMETAAIVGANKLLEKLEEIP